MAQFPTRETEIAAAEQATTTKDEALEDLTDAMRADLRYAENTVDFDDDKLKLLGCRKRGLCPRFLPAAATRGPTRSNAANGPRVPGPSPASPWTNRVRRISTAAQTEATLTSQERGKESEYRTCRFGRRSHVNKTGEGMASNTVMAVL